MKRQGKAYEYAIFEVVCDHYGVSKESILEPNISRKSTDILIRHSIMYFLIKNTYLTLELIGSRFDRGHASVINAKIKIQNRIDTEKRFRAEIQTITSLIEDAFIRIDEEKAKEVDELKKKAIEEGSKTYFIGRCKATLSVDYDKWHLEISTPKAAPTMKEVKIAVNKLIPENITMELLVKNDNKNPFTLHLWEKV